MSASCISEMPHPNKWAQEQTLLFGRRTETKNFFGIKQKLSDQDSQGRQMDEENNLRVTNRLAIENPKKTAQGVATDLGEGGVKAAHARWTQINSSLAATDVMKDFEEVPAHQQWTQSGVRVASAGAPWPRADWGVQDQKKKSTLKKCCKKLQIKQKINFGPII